MKQKLILVTSLLFITVFARSQGYKNLVFTPAQPEPGEVIQFEYSTSGTALGEATGFDAIAYVYDGTLRAQEIPLTPAGNKWTGKINTNDSARAVYIVFKKDALIDNNKEQGYSLMLYKDGNPVKGAYAALAEVNSGFGAYLMQLKTDPAKNLEWMDREFNRYPEFRNKLLVVYAGLLVKDNKATAKDRIKPLIDEALAKKNKTESDYQTIMWAYDRAGNKEASKKLNEEIVRLFPHGLQVKADKVDAFFDERDLAKKEALLTAFVKQYPPQTEADKKSVDNMYSSMASAAAAKKNWELFKKYEAKVTNKRNLSGTYNNLAWNLAGEGLETNADDLVKAKELSRKSLEALKPAIEKLSDKPPYYTDKEYRKNMLYSYGMFGDTYALILWKSGDEREALKYQEEAIKNLNMEDVEANERFIVYKAKLEGSASVKKDIEEYVKEGKSSPALKEILKKSFIADGHNDSEFDAYVANLTKEYHSKLREELLKKMIDEAAPQFALKDLTGKEISLNDLKGKVVVVDFWATWCGPCKASFPGMQTALNKYKNDPDVKFVFVDTWESKKPEEMQKGAGDFIAKNKYDFHVLLDADDKVVGDYAVDGIPTKFVIDPNSRIRFKAVGFDGAADKLVDEITIMVDELKPGGENGVKKGF